jgi:ABC-type Mn2+/Zn2+ transport system ATPase subunit
MIKIRYFKNDLMNLLILENISYEINNQKIISNISLTLKKGEITTLIGPNGGGKTSIARIILGILEPTSGKIINNSTIKNYPHPFSIDISSYYKLFSANISQNFTIANQLFRRIFCNSKFWHKKPQNLIKSEVKKDLEQILKIGYMPQKINIDKTIPLTVKDFLKLSISNIEFNDEVENLIFRLKINNILIKQIHELSGGQMQKVLFLRAIINKPDLLVLDEPTQYMDIAATEEFYQIIEEIRKSQNCAILLISHDLHMVMQKTDSVFCINQHICCFGSPEMINQHPEYISLFGKKTAFGVYHHHHDHNH